jgi:hypothetical protein
MSYTATLLMAYRGDPAKARKLAAMLIAGVGDHYMARQGPY